MFGGFKKSRTFASLLKRKCTGSEKKEFFEKIYINRQVVQEASLTLFIMCRFG